MFGGAHEAGDPDRREEGGIQEEREEAGQEHERSGLKTREIVFFFGDYWAYRSRKDANAPLSASQSNRRAAPVKRERRERSSAMRKRPGRARLGGEDGGADTAVGVGDGVPALIGCETREATTESDGVGKLGVDGVSGGDADAGRLVSSSDT